MFNPGSSRPQLSTDDDHELLSDANHACQLTTEMRQDLAVEPLAIHHVSINVADVEEAVRFYTDVLGCSVRHDRPDFGFAGAWLDVGTQQVHLIAGDVPSSHGQHFAVRVADLDETISELRDRAITVSDASEVGTGRQAFLTDPSGNLIELHQTAAPH